MMQETNQSLLSIQVKTHSRMFKSSGNLAISTLLSRVLGFFREILMAKYVGGGLWMDAWSLSQMIANLSRRILGEGELGHALVPLISNTFKVEGEKRAREKFSTILFWATGILSCLVVVVSLIFYLLSGVLTNQIWKITCEILPIVMPYTIFICIVGVITCYLNFWKDFFLPSLTAILQNVLLILALFFICAKLRQMPLLRALALSVTLSGVIELVYILALLAYRRKLPVFSLKVIRDWTTLKQIFKMIAPGVLAASAFQIGVIADQTAGSLVGESAVSSIYYSNRLYQLPLAIFAISFSTVANTELSIVAAERDYMKFMEILVKTMKVLLFIALPFAAFIACFSTELLIIFFKRGAFSDYAVQMTSYPLAVYACGLPFFFLYKVMVVSFTARREMKTPAKISLLCIVLNIVLNFSLLPFMRQGGIALATVISSAVNNLILLWLFNRDNVENPIPWENILKYLFVKLIPISVIPLIPCRIFLAYVSDRWDIWLCFPILCVMYGTLFCSFAKILHVDELEFFLQRLTHYRH